MRKNKVILLFLVSAMLLGVDAYASDNHADQSLRESVEASSHSSESVGHGIIASGQVTSATVAVPLAIVGSVGQINTHIAEDLVKAATSPIGSPLEITDESVILGPPPGEALNK